MPLNNIRDRQILSLLPIVKKHAAMLHRRLPKRARVRREDLEAAAWPRAIACVDSYRAGGEASLATFAGRGIAGAMLDWLRAENGRNDTPKRRAVEGTQSIEEIAVDWRVRVEADNGSRLVLQQAIGRLPAREQLLIVLRYWQDLTQPEAGRRLGLTCSQAQVLERKALARLASFLQ